MNGIKAFFANNWHSLLAVGILALVVYVIYRSGKKAGSGNYQVINDQGNIVTPTAEQQQTALNVATRIHDDLNSGSFFGLNFFSGTEFGLNNVTRDLSAYQEFATMGDALFAYTAQVYKHNYGTSIFADITAENSLSDGEGTPKYLILKKANTLNLS